MRPRRSDSIGNLGELLQELRVALPGVQVLMFATFWYALPLLRRLSLGEDEEP